MKVKVVCLLFWGLISTATAGECPTNPEAQSILNRCLKAPFIVKTVKEIKSFPACRITTQEGETFFLSMNRKHLIEGISIDVPLLLISKKDYQTLKRNVLFSVGKGPELIVVTNPLCKACLRNQEKIDKLKGRFKLSFVMAGFSEKEIRGAIDAVCRKKSLLNLFKPKKFFKTCDLGKLKVWTVSDIMKRYGITGTPVFIFPDRTVTVGMDEFTRKISRDR